jgi:putative inorganic carbon (hco3(-)) transporter
MTVAQIARASRVDADMLFAVCAAAVLGSGIVVALAGAMRQDLVMTGVGAAMLTAALIPLISAGWIDGVTVVALSLPAPALYETDSARIAPALLVTVAVIVAWVLARGVSPRRLIVGGLPWRSLSCLVGAVVLSALTAQEPLSATREVINWIILISFAVLVTADLTDNPARVRNLALTIALVAGICGFIAPLQSIGILPSRFPRANSSFFRATLGFGWPNEGGMFMALSLPFSAFAVTVARRPGTRALAWVGLGAALMGLVASFSRGSWLSLLMGSLVLLFIGEAKYVRRIWMWALIGSVTIDVVSGGVIRDRIMNTVGDWVIEQRAGLTLAGLLMFREHPLTGVGIGGFSDGLAQYGPQITWLWDYLPTAQNVYVQMAAETGIVGILGLLIFLAAGFRILLRNARVARANGSTADEIALHRTLLWSFATACGLGFVEWLFAHGIGELIMLVVAMGVALTRPGTAEPS